MLLFDDDDDHHLIDEKLVYEIYLYVDDEHDDVRIMHDVIEHLVDDEVLRQCYD